ncbi:MAG: LysM peptidoglycan-binding domain-containing protein [Desulfobacteraceae bacterium]|nr:MAG: LysM peptidoglycan-binding domain-containing protein [Desulfobacteraceae bacterium]
MIMIQRLLCSGRILLALYLATLAILFSPGSYTLAQPLHHTVKKGDTLYSIAKQYFGNPELWPKIWEMNPFVTNPHLLKPGDAIRIGTLEPAALKPQQEAAPAVVRSAEPMEKTVTGINVGAIVPINARGFLSPQEAQPWSVVSASDSQRLLLTKGDLLFLNFGTRNGVKTGDEFTVYRPLSRVRHVITGEDEGILYSARAKIVLREPTVRNIFRAEFEEVYAEVDMGDLVLPFKPIPSCLMPLPTDPNLRGVVIASEQQKENLGRNSIVYLDSGRNKGLVPGSMLELVRFRNVPDPAVPTDSSSLFYEFFKVKSLEELERKISREATVYEKMVGRIIVLDAGPEKATALVLSTNESLTVGTFFRGTSSWGDSAGSPSPLLSCPVR